MIRKIVGAKDPILRQKSKPVKKIDKKIIDLANDLKQTLRVQKDPEGVGLAACQIGKLLRMFAMVFKNDIKVIINPQILSISKQKAISTKKTKNKKSPILEGCLSIPNFYGPLKRAANITLKYQDISGKEIIENFQGFSAQIVQHEVDHLNGKLFVDEIIKQKKPLYKLENDEWEEVELG